MTNLDGIESSKLDNWMIENVDFSSIGEKDYGDCRVEVIDLGLNIDIVVKPLNEDPIDLTKLSDSEVLEKYIGYYAEDDEDDDSWSRFMDPKTDYNDAYGLAEHFAENMSESYVEDWIECLPLERVKEDIYSAIRDAIEANNEQFALYGSSIFEDEISLDSVSQVSISVEYDFLHDVIEADNLLDWRDRYVAAKRG